jgi:hypothetical protein
MADSTASEAIDRQSGGGDPDPRRSTMTADELWEEATRGSTLHRILTRCGLNSDEFFREAPEVPDTDQPSQKLVIFLRTNYNSHTVTLESHL